MSGVIREDRIRNKLILCREGVTSIFQTKQLRYVGHVMRKESLKAIHVIMEINIEKKREENRTKRWTDRNRE